MIETTAELFLVNSENGKVTFLCLLSSLYRSHSFSRIFFFLFFFLRLHHRGSWPYFSFFPKKLFRIIHFLENVMPVHK